MFDFSIIIVSYRARDWSRANLLSARVSSQGLKCQIFVVDNHSEDGTVEMIKNDFSEVRLIANQANVGFARANNQALKQAAGKYIILLNPDMRLRPDTLTKLLAWLENNPQAAITGLKLVDHNGQIVPQVRRFPCLWDQAAIAAKLPHLCPRLLNHYLMSDFNYDQAVAVDSVRGSFFIIRQDVLQNLGLLDERFFVWFEEVDYCQRARVAGLEVWYTPAATAVDYVGQTFKQLPLGQKQRYFRQSMLKYFAKWEPAWQVRLLKLAWAVGAVMGFVGRIFKLASRAKT